MKRGEEEKDFDMSILSGMEEGRSESGEGGKLNSGSAEGSRRFSSSCPKRVSFLPVTLTTSAGEVQNNPNNTRLLVRDKEGGERGGGGPGGEGQRGGSGYSGYLREQLGTPFPHSCLVGHSSQTSGRLLPSVDPHSPTTTRTGRSSNVVGAGTGGISKPAPGTGGSSSGGGGPKFSQTSCLPHHRAGYELEISRSIDVSSSSASIFYKVPVISAGKSSGRREAEDFLGTPSILKPFRDLQEPTRFLTSKSKIGAYVSVTTAGALWSPKIKSSATSVATATVAVTKKASIDFSPERKPYEKKASELFSKRLPRSFSDLPLRKSSSRAEIKEEPKMPIRVRMRRDEYFYMETSSKSTQTEVDTDFTAAAVSDAQTDPGPSSQGTEGEKVDRSTSPIQNLLSTAAGPLQKLEDLEKVTGHFVIQRFFTRTEQEFTTWLEQQLATSSATSTKAIQVAETGSEEKDVQTEIEEEIIPRKPPTPQISITEPPEDAMEAELEDFRDYELEDEVIEEDIKVDTLTVDGGAVVEILRPLNESESASEALVIPDANDNADVGDGTTVEAGVVIESVETVVTESQSSEDNTTAGEINTIVEVCAEQEVESTNNPVSAAPPEETQEEILACKSTDLISCECFASYFLHEENIARLLISLSPRASSTVAEAHFMTTSVTRHDPIADYKRERIAKFEALLMSTKSQILASVTKIKGREDGVNKKSKSIESFACDVLQQQLNYDTSFTSTDNAGACEMYPDFVFPRPNVRRIKRSNSVDSCLGTDYSSIKTRNDSGTSTLGRYVVDGSYEKFSETFDYLQDSQSQADDHIKNAEENSSFRTEDSGMKSGIPESNVSETSLSSPQKRDDDIVEEEIISVKTIPNRKSASGARAKNELRRLKSKSTDRRELMSGESDTESEFIKSENYHARSEAESDTDLTTDGDAIVEDAVAYRRRNDFSDDDDQRFDLDMTDVDDDDKDNDLATRMELDELRLEFDKPLTMGIRNSCTQTNRSLVSPAWSQASASSNTTNGSESHFDLEVVAKKFPADTPMVGSKKHNYLPSSSSSLNYVNFSMNLNVSAKTDESKFKLSVSLPTGPGGRSRPQAAGGRPSPAYKIQSYERRSISEHDQRDLPSLWAHVRNRLDSKVSLAEGVKNDSAEVRRDSIVLSGKCSRPLDPISLKEKPHIRNVREELKLTGQSKKPHQSLRHQQLLQNKAHKNSDRIKRSLARLSKLLDSDK